MYSFYRSVNMLGFLFVCACVIFNAKVHSADTMEEKYGAILIECAEQFSLSSAEVEELKTFKMPDSENARCLFACAYKKIGVLDDKGKLSEDGVKAQIEQRYTDKPEEKKRAMGFLDACLNVNDKPVKDGEKGCERAALIFLCSAEKAPEFGFA